MLEETLELVVDVVLDVVPRARLEVALDEGLELDTLLLEVVEFPGATARRYTAAEAAMITAITTATTAAPIPLRD